MVVAPASITASKMRHRNSRSERPASSAENSTSSVYWRARFTARTAAVTTSSGVMRSFFSMCSGEVAMKVWMRGATAGRSASPARSMSASPVRASAHTRESFTISATPLTAAKSPGLDAGKPASITSTFRRSSALAMRSLSSRLMAAPGLCSPSRMVVSKMISLSLLTSGLRTGYGQPPPGGSSADV